MKKSELQVYENLRALSRAVALSIIERINAALANAPTFSLVLSGGSTPQTLYGFLGGEFREQIPWDRIHLFWGDERYVPSDDRRSNYRMVRESLLDRVPIPDRNVHPMPTHFADPDQAALAYEQALKEHFPSPWPHFDLVLLGLGEEGHTASLFPGSPALDEQERWVVSVRAPAEPPLRLTLTLPVLNHSEYVYFLATGDKKAQAIRHTVVAEAGKAAPPAGMVRPKHGHLVWWTDESAAALLPASLRH